MREGFGAAADQFLERLFVHQQAGLAVPIGPAGNVFSTSSDLPITSSIPPKPPVTGTGTARGVCARSPTRCQSISLS